MNPSVIEISPRLAIGRPYLLLANPPAAMNIRPEPTASQAQRRWIQSAMPTASTKTLVMMATSAASAPRTVTVSVGLQSWFSFTVVV